MLQSLYDDITDIKEKYPNASMLIGGDFNLPGIDWDGFTHKVGLANKQDCELLLDMLVTQSMEQLNKEPTRGSNILELCISSQPEFVQSCTTGPGISDHDHIVIVKCKYRVMQNRKKTRSVHLYNKADWSNIKSYLNEAWETFFMNSPEYNTVDTNWAYFKNTILQAISKFVPEKKFSGKYRPPWFTAEVNRLIRKRQRAYNKAKRINTYESWQFFRKIRSDTQNKIRTAHQDYVNRLISSEDNSTKNMWRYLKGLRKDNCGVGTLVSNGSHAYSPQDKATMLNRQFSSVFTREDLSTSPILNKSNLPKMRPIKVNDQGVLKLLKNLNARKASGSDRIPAILLKNCAEVLCTPLAFIIQQSIDLRTVPEDWREALVSPVFKKGERSKPANYRPVSLTSICCKVCEHVIVSQTMTHLEKNSLLSENQHGFRRKRSCETQLMVTSHDFAEVLNRRSHVDVSIRL